MTSHLSRRFLCAAGLGVLVLAPPLAAAQPQPWTPYSFEGSWGGSSDAIVATGPAQSPPSATFRSVDFADATCRKLAPRPLSFAIPSAYAIQSPQAGSTAGECLWGTSADLERVLRDPREADFTRLRDGVFRSRVALEMGYDSRAKRFVFGAGETIETWRRHSQESGFSNLQLTQEQRAGYPVLRLAADGPGGTRVYMLYLGGVLEDGVLLISYYPSLKGRAVDEAIWWRFVEGIQPQPAKAAASPRS